MKSTRNALLSSLKETFALGIQEFSRSLTGTLPQQASPNTTVGSSGKVEYDENQISKEIDEREENLQQERF